MTQIILDEQLFEREVLLPISRWIVARKLRDLRPHQVIKDDRVPMLLSIFMQKFIFIFDGAFWDRGLRHPKYCILFFPLRNNEQGLIPGLLRRLLQLPEFRTKTVRMGKVVRVSPVGIQYYKRGSQQLHRLDWPK